MKIFVTFLLCFFSLQVLAKETPTVIGKIVKTKHEKNGTNYFITYQRNGKDLAFPISPDSKVRKLHQYIGETVKVFGTTEFKKDPNSETSYTMYFHVDIVKGLSLKDLRYKPDPKKEDEIQFYLTKSREHISPGLKIKGIDDTTANTAIYVGGAALAAEVLSQILKK